MPCLISADAASGVGVPPAGGRGTNFRLKAELQRLFADRLHDTCVDRLDIAAPGDLDQSALLSVVLQDAVRLLVKDLETTADRFRIVVVALMQEMLAQIAAPGNARRLRQRVVGRLALRVDA